MIYTPDTKKAIKLCFEAHRNQTDKSGLPYVFHPFHVAEQMPDEETTIVALLHDVIEDTSYTIDDLRKMGFSEEVMDSSVGCLLFPFPEGFSDLLPHPASAMVVITMASSKDIALFIVVPHIL